MPCGVGDWAVALRSPEGTVSRECARSTRRTRHSWTCAAECAGNRWLPRIELAADLEGGGSVVFLEYVAPVDHPVVKDFAEQWRARAGDPEFREVSRAAQRIDAAVPEVDALVGIGATWTTRTSYRAADRPVLLDVFCMAGSDLYRAILEDVAGVHRRIPRERMRYALEIPYIARENSAAEILALRKAWARGRLTTPGQEGRQPSNKPNRLAARAPRLTAHEGAPQAAMPLRSVRLSPGQSLRAARQRQTTAIALGSA